MNNPEYSRGAFNDSRDERSGNLSNVKAFGTALESEDQKKGSTQCQCYFCEESHPLEECSKFLEIDIKDRAAFISAKRLCFSCLRATNPQHYSRICRNKMFKM